MKKETIETIETILGYDFCNKNLLIQAFTRESYAKEQRVKGLDVTGNEQLEFFGDSVLNMIVVNESFNHFCVEDEELKVKEKEDKLTNFVSYWTNKKMLSSIIDRLDLAKYLIMSKGDTLNKVNEKESVKEDLFEAIVGAMWIDYEREIGFISPYVLELLNISYDEESIKKNSYSELLELRDKKLFKLSEKEYETEAGFIVGIEIKLDFHTVNVEGIAPTIKQAKQEAATKALKKLSSHFNSNINIPDFDEANAINVLQELSQKEIIGQIKYTDIYRFAPVEEWEYTCEIDGFTEVFIGTSKLKKEAKKLAAYQAVRFIADNINNENYNPLNKKELFIFDREEETIKLFVVDKVDSYFYKGILYPVSKEISIPVHSGNPDIFDNIKDACVEIYKSGLEDYTALDLTRFSVVIDKEIANTKMDSLELIKYLTRFIKQFRNRKYIVS